MLPSNRTMDARCPAADEIRALLLGRAARKATDQFADHLSVCPACAALADSVCHDSALVYNLRGDDLPPLPSDHELADVVSRVHQIDRSSQRGPVTRTRPEPKLPDQLGPYRLVELLGAGGMGTVYRAEDTALHRSVAVKVVKGGVDADMRARFLSEARALAAVRHDNVVTVYYVGEEPTGEATIPYLAMELLEGQTLRDWMTGTPPLSIEWVGRAGRQIAAGLAVVHDAGLVHRDIKPANLWLEAPQGWGKQAPDSRPPLDSVGRLKLLDFGLAHPYGAAVEGHAAGTLAYMAPEQAQGEAVDARTDLFGLGCVLYELCTGRLAFPERGRHWTGWDALATPVRALNPAVPERLADLIEQLLAANPDDRPASARAVERELAGLDTPPGRRHRSVTAAVLLAVAVATATIALTNRRPDPVSDPSGQGLAAQATNEPPADQLVLPPTSPHPIDDEWCRDVSKLPPQQQLNMVGPKLAKLNPGYDWFQALAWVEPVGVVRYTLDTDKVSDLSPLRALTSLRVLRCRGSAPGLGLVTDLSPLSERRLIRLFCSNNPGLRDLSPIRLDRLDYLDVSHTGLQTLTGLTRAPLTNLNISGTSIGDLGPVRRMTKLQVFDCTRCPVTDLEPLTAAPLRELHADVRADRDEAVLNRIKTLETINGTPVKEFWKRVSTSVPK